MKRFFTVAFATLGVAQARYPFFIEGQIGYAVGSLWPYIGFGKSGVNTGAFFNQWAYSTTPRVRRHPLKGVTGGIHVGKDLCLPRLPVTFGLMLGGNVMNVRGSAGALNPGISVTRGVFKEKGYMDIAVRVGTSWLNTLFFAKIGCSWQFFKVFLKNSNNDNLVSLNRKTPSLLLGAGVDVWMSKVCLGVVANVHAGRRIPVGIIPGVTASVASAPVVQIRPLLAEILATFKYSLSGKQCTEPENRPSY